MMKGGDAVLVHPWQHHIFVHDHPGMTRLMVSFEAPVGSGYIPQKNKIFRCGEEDFSRLLEIASHYSANDAFSCSLLLALELNKLKMARGGKRIRKDGDMFEAVFTHIHANLSDELPIEDIANEFNMSASNLRLRFRKSVGMSIGQYILRARMQIAMGYLGDSGMSIKEAGLKCGYKSLPAFCNSFKKRIGVYPGEYRKHVSKAKG